MTVFLGLARQMCKMRESALAHMEPQSLSHNSSRALLPSVPVVMGKIMMHWQCAEMERESGGWGGVFER